MASAPVFNARRLKPPCSYEDMIFFADKFAKLSEDFRKKAEAHKDELSGDYPLSAGVCIYDSLFDEYYQTVRNVSDFMSISNKQYPDYTGHE